MKGKKEWRYIVQCTKSNLHSRVYNVAKSEREREIKRVIVEEMRCSQCHVGNNSVASSAKGTTQHSAERNIPYFHSRRARLYECPLSLSLSGFSGYNITSHCVLGFYTFDVENMRYCLSLTVCHGRRRRCRAGL